MNEPALEQRAGTACGEHEQKKPRHPVIVSGMVRKVMAPAATIPSVMEDPTPPARADGSPRPVVDWAAALARHGRWLRRVILTRLGERQAVDEVMQEVSLAAVASAAPPGADGAQVGAWLYRVAVGQLRRSL